MSTYYAEWPSGFRVIWRNLTWSEYNAAKRKYDSSPFINPIAVAMDVYKTVLVDGPDPCFVPAGIPLRILEQQFNGNPFDASFESIARAVSTAREVVGKNYLLMAKAFVAATFHYKLEEIENWDATKLFARLAQAEIVTGRQFDPVKPGQAKNQENTKRRIPLNETQKRIIEKTKGRDKGGT